MVKGIVFYLLSNLFLGCIVCGLVPSALVIGLSIYLGFPWWYTLIIAGMAIFTSYGRKAGRMYYEDPENPRMLFMHMIAPLLETISGILFFVGAIAGIVSIFI